MIGLLQRVSEARVEVDGVAVGRIDRGLLVLVGVQKGDGPDNAARLVERMLGYRVFEDAEGRMNRGLLEVGGGLLLVPQFTLAADTRKGRRPSFSGAAPPARAAQMFDILGALARERLPAVQTGRFGANMQVSLVNDGPVTFWLEA